MPVVLSLRTNCNRQNITGDGSGRDLCICRDFPARRGAQLFRTDPDAGRQRTEGADFRYAFCHGKRAGAKTRRGAVSRFADCNRRDACLGNFDRHPPGEAVPAALRRRRRITGAKMVPGEAAGIRGENPDCTADNGRGASCSARDRCTVFQPVHFDSILSDPVFLLLFRFADGRTLGAPDPGICKAALSGNSAYGGNCECAFAAPGIGLYRRRNADNAGR